MIVYIAFYTAAVAFFIFQLIQIRKIQSLEKRIDETIADHKRIIEYLRLNDGSDNIGRIGDLEQVAQGLCYSMKSLYRDHVLNLTKDAEAKLMENQRLDDDGKMRGLEILKRLNESLKTRIQ